MDNWRSIDVYNATISFNGHTDVTINVLEVIAKGRMADLEITGMADSRPRAKKSKQHDARSSSLQPITIASPQYYSIGTRPTSLWLGTNSTWYSIHFTKKSNMVWNNYYKVFNVFFAVSGYYHESSDRLQLPVEQQVFEIMAQHSVDLGEGCTIKDAVLLVQENRDFLILHIGREPQYKSADGTIIKLKDSGFYKWLRDNPHHAWRLLEADQCPDIEQLEHSIQYAHQGTGSGHDSDSEVDDGLDGDGDVHMSNGIAETVPDSNIGLVNLHNLGKGPHKGLYVSPQFPADTPMPTTYVDIYLAIAYHYVASARDGKTLDTLTAAGVATTVYRDFTITRPETSARLLKDNAITIYNALPANFQRARIGQGLLQLQPERGPIHCSNAHHSTRANDQWNDIVTGREILKQRGTGNLTGRMDKGKGKVKEDVREASVGVAEESRDVVQHQRTPGYINGKPIPKPIRRSLMYDC